VIVQAIHQLRFFLDNDVDVRVCRDVLTPLGHNCWSAGQAGRYLESDDSHTIYARDKDAIVITHDREFTERRRRAAIGRHIQMDCEQPDACEILSRYIEELVPILAAAENITVVIRRDGYATFYGWS
jgi:hypothetical protein